jgi:hypothetical protein
MITDADNVTRGPSNSAKSGQSSALDTANGPEDEGAARQRMVGRVPVKRRSRVLLRTLGIAAFRRVALLCRERAYFDGTGVDL